MLLVSTTAYALPNIHRILQAIVIFLVVEGGFTYNGTADKLYFPPKPAVRPKPANLKGGALKAMIKAVKKPNVPVKPDHLIAASADRMAYV